MDDVAIIAALCTIVTGCFKGLVCDRWLPIISLGTGMVFALVLVGTSRDSLGLGIGAALVAGGIYSGAKTLAEPEQPQ